MFPGREQELNRAGHPPVELNVAWDVVSFRAETWQPIVRVRVEDAFDARLGWTSHDHFAWAS